MLIELVKVGWNFFLCVDSEGEACVAPQVQKSESVRAQNNYNLIEESQNILKLMSEVELEVM